MRYKALALQTTCHALNRLDDVQIARDALVENIRRVGRQVQASKQFIGPDLHLVVLPEYFATGFPMEESLELWREKACLSVEEDAFGEIRRIALDNGIYLSGNFYEADPHFPNCYFQSGFILGPKGETLLLYRRLNSMFAVTPYDVLDQYLEIYGWDSLFPVVETPIGRLACIASEEILYPEIARCLMMNGAEVFCHHTSEVSSPMPTQKHIAKLARAIENMAYVVSANSASIRGTSFPEASTDGRSQIVQFDGLVLTEAGQGESMVAHATLDIGALRHQRERPGMANFISRQRNALFAKEYARHEFYPPNTWKPGFQKAEFLEIQRRVIRQLYPPSS